jgi:hypothetical protein
MKGWLLRQPAKSRLSEDITSASPWRLEGASQYDVSYRERLMGIESMAVMGGP